jgi:hypothetical protein
MKCKSVWLLSRSQHNTSVYEAGGLRHPKFNSGMSMAAVFLDTEKVFDKTWHSGLLYKLSELAFSTSLIQQIASFLSNRKFKVLVGEFSTPRNIAAGMPQGSVLAAILYSLYIRCPCGTWNSSWPVCG